MVGVGNIYASEALYLAGINPRRAAGRIARHRYETLAEAVSEVLSKAIKAGGTTLRDFYGGDGEAGYFQQQLEAYGREDEPCRRCNTPITAIVQGQRTTYYCKQLPDIMTPADPLQAVVLRNIHPTMRIPHVL